MTTAAARKPFEFTEKQNDLIGWCFGETDLTKPAILFWPGGIRSGKTVGAVGTLTLHGLYRLHNGQRVEPYIVAAKSKLSSEMNHLPPFRMVAEHLNLPVKYARGDGILHVGPVPFRLVGGAQSDSAGRIRGMTASGAYIDEVIDLDEGFVNEAIGRCSAPGARIILTTNKGGPGHWAKRWFYDSGDYRVMESTLDDNPHITDATREFYGQALGGHYAARMLRNEWAGAGGLVYTRWSQLGTDDIGDRYGGPRRLVDICVDWGTASVTAALVVEQAVDDDHTWAVTGEYYWDARLTGERSVGEHADAIVRLAGGRMTGDCVIDPSATALRLELRRRGLTVRRGNNEVLEGISGMNTLFTMGRLKISADCRETIRELQGYEWDAGAAEAGDDRPVKRNDHAVDALRYWCQRRYRGGIERVLRSTRIPEGL